ncbi:MAG: alpha/beta fold hydrolase [Candidatus Eiseniibacteriota bacterium]
MATFVLVHGSCHGGWYWKKVTPLLSENGHKVYTPTLTGLGESLI